MKRTFPIRPTVLLMLVVGCLIGQPRTSSAQQRPTEFEVKAAYLVNFGKFVTWPVGNVDNRTMKLCLLGRDPFGETLDRIAREETIRGRTATVVRIQAASQADSCQMLFLSSSEEERHRVILDELAGKPILTVSDSSEFLRRGGILQFVNEGERVRFRVNLAAAEKAGLVMSSELLRVAQRVMRAQNGGAQ